MLIAQSACEVKILRYGAFFLRQLSNSLFPEVPARCSCYLATLESLDLPLTCAAKR